MRVTTRRRYLLLPLALLAPALCLRAQQDTFTAPRVVAIGDVHGDFAQFTAVLRDAGLIDANGKWTGGKTHLVQTGDVPDRGPDTRKAMDLLMELERQAKKAGGAVHALIGNHEAMNVYGDLRYVTPAEFEAFRTKNSADLRRKYWEQHAAELEKNPAGPKPDAAYRTKWEAQTPLGWIEHRLAFRSDGVYGRWIGRHNAVVKINDTVFLHGGISPKFASWTISAMNRKIREELADFPKLQGGIAQDEEGPLWYRGLAAMPEAAQAAHLDALLALHGARRIVMAHTPGPAVLPRFQGKAVIIDVGLSKAYGGPPACLVLEDGKAFTIHRGKTVPIPDSGQPADVAAYLRRLAELDPPPSPILKLLAAPAAAAAAAAPE